MARKPNYRFEKVERERKKAAKRAAKEEKRQKKDDEAPPEDEVSAGDQVNERGTTE